MSKLAKVFKNQANSEERDMYTHEEREMLRRAQEILAGNGEPITYNSEEPVLSRLLLKLITQDSASLMAHWELILGVIQKAKGLITRAKFDDQLMSYADAAWIYCFFWMSRKNAVVKIVGLLSDLDEHQHEEMLAGIFKTKERREALDPSVIRVFFNEKGLQASPSLKANHRFQAQWFKKILEDCETGTFDFEEFQNLASCVPEDKLEAFWKKIGKNERLLSLVGPFGLEEYPLLQGEVDFSGAGGEAAGVFKSNSVGALYREFINLIARDNDAISAMEAGEALNGIAPEKFFAMSPEAFLKGLKDYCDRPNVMEILQEYSLKHKAHAKALYAQVFVNCLPACSPEEFGQIVQGWWTEFIPLNGCYRFFAKVDDPKAYASELCRHRKFFEMCLRELGYEKPQNVEARCDLHKILVEMPEGNVWKRGLLAANLGLIQHEAIAGLRPQGISDENLLYLMRNAGTLNSFDDKFTREIICPRMAAYAPRVVIDNRDGRPTQEVLLAGEYVQCFARLAGNDPVLLKKHGVRCDVIFENDEGDVDKKIPHCIEAGVSPHPQTLYDVWENSDYSPELSSQISSVLGFAESEENNFWQTAISFVNNDGEQILPEAQNAEEYTEFFGELHEKYIRAWIGKLLSSAHEVGGFQGFIAGLMVAACRGDVIAKLADPEVEVADGSYSGWQVLILSDIEIAPAAVATVAQVGCSDEVFFKTLEACFSRGYNEAAKIGEAWVPKVHAFVEAIIQKRCLKLSGEELQAFSKRCHELYDPYLNAAKSCSLKEPLNPVLQTGKNASFGKRSGNRWFRVKCLDVLDQKISQTNGLSAGGGDTPQCAWEEASANAESSTPTASSRRFSLSFLSRRPSLAAGGAASARTPAPAKGL
jgi:hypothetical protein